MTQVTTATHFPRNTWRPAEFSCRDEGMFEGGDPVLASLYEDYPGLPELLIEARGELRARFGGAAEFVLTGKVDPEGGDSYAVLHVHTSLSTQDAARALDAFDEDWWLDHAGELLNLLVIDFEKS